jgi:plasmid replication initiation protein
MIIKMVKKTSLARTSPVGSSYLADHSLSEQKRQYIIKNTAFVHMSNDLPMITRKILNIFADEAKLQTDKKKRFCITRKELIARIGWDSVTKMPSHLRESAKLLIANPISWNLLNQDKNFKGIDTVFVYEIIWEEDMVYFSITPSLLEHIRTSTLYAKIDSEIHREIKSKAVLALYEIANNALSISKKEKILIPPIEIEQLKKLLVENTSYYKEFRRFNEKVLTKAVNELNRDKDIEIRSILHKKSRTVTHISFEIKRKVRQQNLFNENNDVFDSISRSLIGSDCEAMADLLKIDKPLLVSMIARYGRESVEKEIIKLNKRIKDNSKIDNIEAYLKGMLKNCEKVVSSDDVIGDVKALAKEKAQASEQKRKQEIEDFLKDKDDDYRGVVEILLRYYPVSYCRNMLLTSRDEPIQIRKHDAHVSCDVTGLYINRHLQPILKDLEGLFGCAVDLTIDGLNEQSASLVYTGSFEELEEEIRLSQRLAAEQTEVAQSRPTNTAQESLTEFLQGKDEQYKAMVEILQQYFSVSELEKALTESNNSIMIEKDGDVLACSVQGLSIDRDIGMAIQKALTQLFDSAVHLYTQDGVFGVPALAS